MTQLAHRHRWLMRPMREQFRWWRVPQQVKYVPNQCQRRTAIKEVHILQSIRRAARRGQSMSESELFVPVFQVRRKLRHLPVELNRTLAVLRLRGKFKALRVAPARQPMKQLEIR